MGITFMFYQKFRDLIKNELLAMFDAFIKADARTMIELCFGHCPP
jgi:hypothetical protein